MDTPASHLPALPPATSGESPGPGSSSRRRVDVFRPRKEPNSPGHGTGPVRLPGTAWHYSGLHWDGTAAPGTGTSIPRARPGIFLDGQKQAGEGGEGEDGLGRGRERKQLHGCRMSRTVLHGRRGDFSPRFSSGGAAGSRRQVGAARRQCLRSRRLVPGRLCLQALEEEGIARRPPGAVAELPDASPLPHGALLPSVALRAAAGGEWDRHQRPASSVPSCRVPCRPA